MSKTLFFFKRFTCVLLIVALLNFSLVWTYPAYAARENIKGIRSNVSRNNFRKEVNFIRKDWIGQAVEYRLIPSPTNSLCQAYRDNDDKATKRMMGAALTSFLAFGYFIAHASFSGAGELAAYAGITAVIAKAGLGGIVTSVAGMLGSTPC